MNRLSLPALLLSGVVFWSLPSTAHAELTLTGTPKISFHAKGPAGFNIDGSSSSMTLIDNGSTLKMSVPMDSVETGIELRDEHMRDYAGADAHPAVSLELPLSALALPAEKGDKTNGVITGTFTCNGQSQPVEVSWTLKKGGSDYTLNGSFNFNTESHGIEIPNYMGITVDPAMSASAKLKLVER